MSLGSHSPLLERAIINVQALGDRTNPSVLWLTSDLNIKKNGIFAIQLYFLYFLIVKNDRSTFFNSRIRVELQANRLHIDMETQR